MSDRIRELFAKYETCGGISAAGFLYLFGCFWSFSPYSNMRMGISAGMPSLVGKPFQRLAPLVTKMAVPSSL